MAVCAIVFGGIYLTRIIGKSDKVISQESVNSKLARIVNDIGPVTSRPVKSLVEYDDTEGAAAELPDIDTCEIGTTSSTSLYAEIYSSPEEAGTGTDGWLCKMAENFNSRGYTVNGVPVSVQIRKVDSGQALDYIATGKAVPDGFSPSSMLWVDMLNAKGVRTEIMTEKMAGNVAGILLSKDGHKEILEKCGSVDLKAITEAKEASEFTMGYTNPFASSAGLNFLICTLERYDRENPLSDMAVERVRKFQENVPFVTLTTIQIREAAERGSLDGFILDYQSYMSDSALSRNYQFTPFGYRHDNPLVSVGELSGEKVEVLKRFAEHCAAQEALARVAEYGFVQVIETFGSDLIRRSASKNSILQKRMGEF